MFGTDGWKQPIIEQFSGIGPARATIEVAPLFLSEAFLNLEAQDLSQKTDFEKNKTSTRWMKKIPWTLGTRRENHAKKKQKYPIIFFFPTTLLGLKEPRHSETISHEKNSDNSIAARLSGVPL